jgi:hypothetical protein
MEEEFEEITGLLFEDLTLMPLARDGCRRYRHPNGNTYTYRYLGKKWCNETEERQLENQAKKRRLAEKLATPLTKCAECEYHYRSNLISDKRKGIYCDYCVNHCVKLRPGEKFGEKFVGESNYSGPECSCGCNIKW